MQDVPNEQTEPDSQIDVFIFLYYSATSTFKKASTKTVENTWWHLRAHSRTLSRRDWLNSQWRVCASSYHIESEPKQQSWPYISARGPRTHLSTLAPCPSLSHRWEWGTAQYIGADILLLAIIFSCFRSESNLLEPAWNIRKPGQLLQFLLED